MGLGRPRLMLLLGTFAVLRVFASAGLPVRFPDTPTYLPLNFLGQDARLWTIPLVWNLADTDMLRVAVQVVFGVVAWTVLALEVGRLIADVRVRWAALALVLALGLVPQVTEWDRCLLSESLSTSLLVLLVASLLRVSTGRSRAPVAAAIGITTLWIFTRQLNAILFLVLLPLVLGYVAWRLRGRERVAVAAALVLIGGWSTLALTADTRQSQAVETWNSVQIVETRIAVNPAALAFFEARGLPPSRYIAAERGNFPGSTSPLFADRPFMQWIDHRFESVYASYLLHRWRSTLTKPFEELPAAISFPMSFTSPREVLPESVGRSLWDSEAGIGIFAVLAAIFAGLAVGLRARVRAIPVVMLLVAFAAVGTVLTWNLTGFGPNDGEVSLARLFLPVAVAVRIAILVGLASSVDSLLAHLKLSAHGQHVTVGLSKRVRRVDPAPRMSPTSRGR
jgi:hypothetical protein